MRATEELGNGQWNTRHVRCSVHSRKRRGCALKELTCDRSMINREACGHEEEANGEMVGACRGGARAIASVVLSQKRHLISITAACRNR
jgi:hypothetical protein